MRVIFSNTKLIIIFVAGFSMIALIQSCVFNDPEWFQASGAVVTIGGLLLAARKIIRLGIESFIRDAKTFDGGGAAPTQEEIEADNQFEADIIAYKSSIWLIALGTLIWAYGGILLRLFGIVYSA